MFGPIGGIQSGTPLAKLVISYSISMQASMYFIEHSRRQVDSEAVNSDAVEPDGMHLAMHTSVAINSEENCFLSPSYLIMLSFLKGSSFYL